MKPWVLGLSTGYHNGAACLCRGDEIVVAIQEERLTRMKRDRIVQTAPSKAIQYCLSAANIRLSDVNLIVDCSIRKSASHADKTSPAVFGHTDHLPEVIQIPHHFGHAMSAFSTSGFSEAAVLVIDGGGSFGSHLNPLERGAAISYADDRTEHLSIYYADSSGLVPVEKHMSNVSYDFKGVTPRMPIFRSLGHMFSSVALGIFGDYFEAGKVMALAPFGHVSLPPSCFFKFDGYRFIFLDDVPEKFPGIAVWPQREQECKDLAASVQAALENALASVLRTITERQLCSNLCYAGGVALNSVANHKVVNGESFKNVHIIAAAEDSGTAIGAAYYGVSLLSGKTQSRRLVTDSLGRSYNGPEADRALQQMPGVEVIDTDDVLDKCIDLLCDGKIVGWFNGGSEFGPRALGHRSILCDPRRHDAKDILNSRVKHREAFRPFAPAILAEHATEWFAIDQPNALMDFMLDVSHFRPHLAERIPAVLHVDGTGRLQTVRKSSSPRFYELIRRFHVKTGVPIILNTSMNIMGEPIVETPKEAIWLLLSTGLDYCIIDDRVVGKAPTFTSVLDLPLYRTAAGTDSLPGSTNTQNSRDVADSRTMAKLRDVLKSLDNKSSYRAIFGAQIQSPKDELEHVKTVTQLFRFSLIQLEPYKETAVM